MSRKECDICDRTLEGFYIDGKTKQGPWANMCGVCYDTFGVGLGIGLGKLYELEEKEDA